MEPLTLSPLALFQHAGWVGKGVMVTLGVLSVYCWILIVDIIWGYWRLRKALAASAGPDVSPLLAPLTLAGQKAAGISLSGEAVGEALNRIEDAMERAGQRLLQPALRNLNGLAIISSAAPFIGLFGTVWGIVNSFSSIANARDTSLAVVAPGIAEALAATAFGLLAAIPASVAYNRLSEGLNTVSADLSDLAAEQAVHFMSQRQSDAGGAE